MSGVMSGGVPGNVSPAVSGNVLTTTSGTASGTARGKISTSAPPRHSQIGILANLYRNKRISKSYPPIKGRRHTPLYNKAPPLIKAPPLHQTSNQYIIDTSINTYSLESGAGVQGIPSFLENRVCLRIGDLKFP